MQSSRETLSTMSEETQAAVKRHRRVRYRVSEETTERQVDQSSVDSILTADSTWSSRHGELPPGSQPPEWLPGGVQRWCRPRTEVEAARSRLRPCEVDLSGRPYWHHHWYHMLFIQDETVLVTLPRLSGAGVRLYWCGTVLKVVGYVSIAASFLGTLIGFVYIRRHAYTAAAILFLIGLLLVVAGRALRTSVEHLTHIEEVTYRTLPLRRGNGYRYVAEKTLEECVDGGESTANVGFKIPVLLMRLMRRNKKERQQSKTNVQHA